MFSKQAFAAQDTTFSIERLIRNVFQESLDFYNRNHLVDADFANEMTIDKNQDDNTYQIRISSIVFANKLKDFFTHNEIPFEVKHRKFSTYLVIPEDTLQNTNATYQSECNFLFELHELIQGEEVKIKSLPSKRDALHKNYASEIERLQREYNIHFLHKPESYLLSYATIQIASERTISEKVLDIVKSAIKDSHDYHTFSYGGEDDHAPSDLRIQIKLTENNVGEIQNVIEDLAQHFVPKLTLR